MRFGKQSLDENMLAQKLYQRLFGNLMIHTFGRTHGDKEAFLWLWDAFD
jgi:hypothetical protein